MTILCAFTQHDRRVRLVQAHLVHFFNPPCCRPASCGCNSHVTCAVAKMRRDYSFVSDVETIDVKRQLYGWIQLILVYLLSPLSVSPCSIIVHRAWFALIEPKMFWSSSSGHSLTQGPLSSASAHLVHHARCAIFAWALEHLQSCGCWFGWWLRCVCTTVWYRLYSYM